jgi:hypothetical protein
MISHERIQEWAKEAVEASDPLLGALLLHIASLTALSDYRALEIARNYCKMRVEGKVLDAQDVEDIWPELLEG